MDALTVTTPTERRPEPHVAITYTVAVAAGLVMGALDLLAQKAVPYPWADLANSSAVWAVLAFVVGYCVTSNVQRAVLSGAVLLTVAVESYYLTAVVVQHDSSANLASPSTVMWLMFAVTAGVLFGAAGNWSRYADTWLASAGTALAVSVLYAEAFVRIHNHPLHHGNRLLLTLVEAAIGVLVLVVAGRTHRQRAIALPMSVPLTALGVVAFTSVGYGR